MARSKKPRKKYQPARAYTERMLGRLRLTAFESYGKDANGEGLYRTNMPFDVVEQAVDFPRKWFVEAVVTCDPGGGQDYYEESEGYVTDPVRLNDIADEILATIERVKQRDVNANHIVDWGWRARLVTDQLLKELRIEDALALEKH